MFDQLIEFRTLGFLDAVLRIFLAGAFGLVLGLERSWKNKPMDFRAFVIVGVITCIVAIMAQEIYADYSSTDQTVLLDFMQLIGGTLTALGFLGAGAILHSRDNRVIGTATGASIWASGGLGMALGFGFYALSALGFLAIFAALFLFGLMMPAPDDDDEDRRRS